LRLQRRAGALLPVGDHALEDAGLPERLGVEVGHDRRPFEMVSPVDEETRRAKHGMLGRDVEGDRIPGSLTRDDEPRVDARTPHRREEEAVDPVLAGSYLQRPRRRRRSDRRRGHGTRRGTRQKEQQEDRRHRAQLYNRRAMWWESWFGEEYLDLYPHRDLESARREVQFALAHLPGSPTPLLDLCCGSGRHAVPFADAGFPPVGLDS